MVYLIACSDVQVGFIVLEFVLSVSDLLMVYVFRMLILVLYF